MLVKPLSLNLWPLNSYFVNRPRDWVFHPVNSAGFSDTDILQRIDAVETPQMSLVEKIQAAADSLEIDAFYVAQIAA